MVPLYEEEWGNMGRGVRKFGGCLGMPIWNTYQEMYMCSPPLVHDEELGGRLGNMGKGWS